MLEALSYGLPVLASDIPPNREIGLNAESYYAVGNVDDLTARLSGTLRRLARTLS